MTKELFLEDSYLKEIDANVISIENNKVELDQTIFYPRGGGQENDTGILKQGNKVFHVQEVKKENGKVFHYVELPSDISLGPVKAIIDWEQRFEYMRHHSMLHVIGAVFHREYQSLCTGNQIHHDRARIDLTEISNLEEEEILSVIQEANNEVTNNHPISARVLPRENIENLSEAVKTIVNLIPKSLNEIRFVSIGDIDDQPCGGTHVRKTSEIGKIFLQKTKRKGKGITRLELRIVNE